MNEQQRHLGRVREKIGDIVVRFWRERLDSLDSGFFGIEELTDYVGRARDVAPASPDRVLRALRQARRINYEVVSRVGAYYRALPLPRAAD